MKQYIRQSPMVYCPCGIFLREYNLHTHRRKSKRHYLFMNSPVDMQILRKEMSTLKDRILNKKEQIKDELLISVVDNI